jgi:Abortive infection C-terminus
MALKAVCGAPVARGDMHILYYGGTSRLKSVTVPESVGPSERRHDSIGKALHILHARGQTDAERILRDFPFGYFEVGDGFDDDYYAELHARLPVKDHHEFGRGNFAQPGDGHDPFRNIARAFEDSGYALRAIAVHVHVDGAKSQPNPLALSHQEVQRVVSWIGVTEGYLASFSYSKHTQFYADLNLPYSPQSIAGTTRERFISILEGAPPDHQAIIIHAIIDRCPAEPAFPKRTPELKKELEFYVARLSGAPITLSPIVSTSEVVRRALTDAKELIRSAGPTSAVDRVHTALHGYLREKCAEIAEPAADDATVPTLLNLLRSKHPSLQQMGPRPDDVTKILRSLGGALDALGTVRNKSSMSHANHELLPEAEARFVLNTVHTILNYLRKSSAPRRENQRELFRNPWER